MDAINGFNELERATMQAVIVVDPRLHFILPLYDMVYTDKKGELWYFDENGVLTHTHFCLDEKSDRGAFLVSSSSASRWRPSTEPSRTS